MFRGIKCLYLQGTEAVYSYEALGTNCETVWFDTEDSNLNECPPPIFLSVHWYESSIS